MIDGEVVGGAQTAGGEAVAAHRGRLVQADHRGATIMLPFAESHAFQRRLEMKRAGGIVSIPVPDAKGGVARGLGFDHQDTRAQGMADPAGEPDAVARSDLDANETFEQAAFPQGLEKELWCDVVLDPPIDRGPGAGFQHEPGFVLDECFRMLRGVGRIRMNLDREVVFGVEQFHEEWKAAGGGR